MQQLKVVCSVLKESQSLMQIRECKVGPNWVERLVHEVKVVQMMCLLRKTQQPCHE